MTDPKTPSVDFCPEAELLLCCARTQMDAENAERIKTLLQSGINWDSLLPLAGWHKMLPLLYWHLNAICREAVPEAGLAQLQNYFQANLKRNMSLTGELLKLLKLFEANDIPAITYKGPVLAASVYRNLALRQCGDLDFLVRKPDVLKAKDLLMSEGYQPEHQLSPVQEAAYMQSDCEYNFNREADRLHVELHWQIVPRHLGVQFDPGSWWDRLELVSLAGAPVPNLPPEVLLMVLCIHGFKHCWAQLNWIGDIAELIRTHQMMDWGKVLDLANRLGGERMLFLGPLLAKDLLGPMLPKEVQQRMQGDRVAKSLAAQVREWLFHEAGYPPGGPIDPLGESYFRIRTMKRLRDRVRYGRFLFRRIMTPNVRDQETFSFPGFLSFFYYLSRPIRLFKTYGLSKLRHLLRS